MDLEKLIFEISLYNWIDISDNESLYNSIKKSGAEVEGYNPYRKVESTFAVIKGLGNLHENGICGLGERQVPEIHFNSYSDNLVTEPSNSLLVLKCKRYEDLLYIYFQIDEEKGRFRKVGQNPSVADFHLAKVKKYTKYLINEDLREFTRAIGLYANGVGIGSFVYLRRIFEKLIFEAGDKVIATGSIQREEFAAKRVDEKIEIAKAYLPAFLVENRAIYGILSKGIHQLSEQECLSYFNVVKKGIEIILEEKIENEEREKSRKALADSISKIAGKIKNI